MYRIKKYTLYVGLNDKETKTQKVNTVEAYKIIENLLLNLNVEGATIFEAKGQEWIIRLWAEHPESPT